MASERSGHQGIVSRLRAAALLGAAAFALAVSADLGLPMIGGAVLAQGHEDDGHGGPGGAGGAGSHDDGHEDGGHEDDGHEDDGHEGGQGRGQGGGSDGSEPGPRPEPGNGSDGGARHRGGDGAVTGGRPPWAQEGIPEVELGRLNVARSPDRVFDRAYSEALATLTPEMIEFYSLDHDEMITELSLNWDDVSLIDSPLQNLALMEEALDGNSVLVTEMGVTNENDALLAVFLGTASDKTVPISTDTVVAVTTILGTPITGREAEELAEDAEEIRIAILAGHG